EISRGKPIKNFEDLVMVRVATALRSIERVARALRVADDSFSPEMSTNDVVVYSERIGATPGSTVVAEVGDLIYVGAYYKVGADVIIRTRANPSPVRAPESQVSILGVVIGVQRLAATTGLLRRT
ncbi:MAG TPA: S24 family peptidase, partial [Blastocatellia bacterium]